MDDLIDSHAHVWDGSCAFVDGARYHPDYEATTDSYLKLLDFYGINRAVLVQPSFLGTDNSYLLKALRAHAGRLRGIVVLDPGASASQLDDLTAQGVIGLRYNLLSLDPSNLAHDHYQALTEDATARGWWIEVQARGQDWPQVLPHVANARLMVDHYGKPSGLDCKGFQALMERDPATTCVKISAPYRQQMDDMAPYAARLEDRFSGRLLWGSDWPWTQHERSHGYADTLRWLKEGISPEEQARISARAPAILGFEGT